MVLASPGLILTPPPSSSSPKTPFRSVYFAHWMGFVWSCMSNCCLQGQVQLGEGGSSFHSGIEFGRSRTCGGSSGGRKKGVVWGVGQELLGPSYFFHIISARPSKQPLMVRTFLKVYMELGSYFLFLQEQIKDIIIVWAGKIQFVVVRKVCDISSQFFLVSKDTDRVER